jgi:hypothetical protein
MTPVHAERRSSFGSKGFDRSQMAPVASATRPTSDGDQWPNPLHLKEALAQAVNFHSKVS